MFDGQVADVRKRKSRWDVQDAPALEPSGAIGHSVEGAEDEGEPDALTAMIQGSWQPWNEAPPAISGDQNLAGMMPAGDGIPHWEVEGSTAGGCGAAWTDQQATMWPAAGETRASDEAGGSADGTGVWSCGGGDEKWKSGRNVGWAESTWCQDPHGAVIRHEWQWPSGSAVSPEVG